MSTKFKNLRNDLEDLEKEQRTETNRTSSYSKSKTDSKLPNYILLFAFLATFLFYTGSKLNVSSLSWNPVSNIVEQFNQPDEDLLNRMGAWMEDMGYGNLSHEVLTSLRDEGVTATYTSQIREAGYPEITLDELVELKKADVSSTFTRMMKELGYQLSVDELITLNKANVTAYFTSNMLDLGYSKEQLSIENLVRLRKNGITHQLAEKAQKERGALLSFDELIRYRISNQ